MAMLFYYKNEGLLQSLYAQIFAGLLKEVSTSEKHEESNKLNASGSGEAQVSAVVAKGKVDARLDGSSLTTDSDDRSETIIPHDALALDVLETLTPFMKTNIAQATRGDIIQVKGALLLFPKELEANCIEPLLPVLERAVTQNLTEMDRKQRKALTDMMKNFLKIGNDTCRFIFKTETENFLTGYMKRSDFTEDSLSLFFRYKASMIPCQLIGILEKHPHQKLADDEEAPSFFQGLLGLQTAAADIWTQGLPDADTVTPITVYLPLNTENEEAL